MRRAVLILAAACLLGASAEARDLKITVYNSNIGVVKDTRSADLERGTNRISVDEIASRIDPTSVRISIEARGETQVLEQNFEYDLMSPDKLLQKYLEQEIEVGADDGSEYRGRLLGWDARNLVLALADGRTAVVSRDKATDIVLPALETGLISKPTLVWEVRSSSRTPAEMEVAYMTEGINWHAEYTATLGGSDDRLDLASWVSVENRSGASYPDAKLKLIAGEIHRAEEKKMVRAPMLEPEFAASMPFEEKAFFEYHMYTLDGTTTLKDNEVKQIQFLGETEVKAKKEYNFDAMRNDKVMVVMRFVNSEESGLGIPLPAGKVRVFKADDDGSLEFVGEDRIDHVPKDEEIKLYLGDAFDIVAERTTTDFNRLSDRVTEESVKIEVANHKDEGITVIVSEHLYGDWNVRGQSHPYTKIKADQIDFEVAVDANSASVVTYTVRRKM
jgi:hypothetical protein